METTWDSLWIRNRNVMIHTLFLVYVMYLNKRLILDLESLSKDATKKITCNVDDISVAALLATIKGYVPVVLEG
jgi:hypothetical protein